MNKSQKTSPLQTPSVEDRGEAKYFHGRKKILDNFKKRLELVNAQKKYGTIILIQAAPGAGKTALLAKCAQLAGEQGWKIADTSPGSILDTAVLLQELGWSGEKEISEDAVLQEILLRMSRIPHPPPLAVEILQEEAKPLLLVLDEAQRLLEDIPRDPRGQFSAAKTLLKGFHNGELPRRVILMAGGLGVTTQAFERLGVSRFKDNCYIELGELSEDTERLIIHDWLLKDGSVKGDPAYWIDTIAQDTHGWAQHVTAYAQVAAYQLSAIDGQMTMEGLDAVIEAGREKRIRFYKDRARGIPEEHLHCIARVLTHVDPGNSVARRDIMASLKLDYDHNTAARLFLRAVYKGILDERDNRYVVPIPSMHNWLVDNFSRIQEPIFPPHSSMPMGFDSRDRGVER